MSVLLRVYQQRDGYQRTKAPNHPDGQGLGVNHRSEGHRSDRMLSRQGRVVRGVRRLLANGLLDALDMAAS